MQTVYLLTRHSLSTGSFFQFLILLTVLMTFSVTFANQDSVTGVLQPAVLDFDGDNKTDYAVVRDSGGSYFWYLQRSTLGPTTQPWGITGDQFIPGDYDGDGKWDIAVWRSGTPANFYIFRSLTSSLQTVPFGQPSDDPRITQDFDGDFKADPAVVRNVGGTLVWYIQRSLLGFTSVTFGTSTDVAIRGDFDGDAKADVAVFRTGTGTPANTFFILRSSDGGTQAATLGNFSTDFIVPADFDGDGKTDYALWRGFGPSSDGTWYWLRSSDGGSRSLPFGTSDLDRPTPGDYDGDGITDHAVWRPGSPATFYVNRSLLGFTAVSFGATGDIVPAHTLQAR